MARSCTRLAKRKFEQLNDNPGQTSTSRASHGGITRGGAVELLVKKEFMELGASKGKGRVIVDFGSGDGSYLNHMRTRDECSRCNRFIGVEIDRGRIEESRVATKDDRAVEIIEGSFVLSEMRKSNPDGADVINNIAKGREPIIGLFNNSHFCMVDSRTDQIQNAPQCKFGHEINEEGLFCVGSIIICYTCLGLDESVWELEVYEVLNMPAGCFSWVGRDFDQCIYKYKKIGAGEGGGRRKSHRARRVYVDYRVIVGGEESLS